MAFKCFSKLCLYGFDLKNAHAGLVRFCTVSRVKRQELFFFFYLSFKLITPHELCLQRI